MENLYPFDIVTEESATQLRDMFRAFLNDYRQKPDELTDEEWLERLFSKELADCTDDQASEDSKDIVKSIEIYNKELDSVTEASKHGISKERWLGERIHEASVGVTIQQFGNSLSELDSILAHKNNQLNEIITIKNGAGIKMSPNLDGNIAEGLIAHSAGANAAIHGKNIDVVVREVNTKNSVDVRAINLDTGEYKNFQLKFGKDAKTTIQLIERGDYSNQRIIVPSEQLDEVQQHFKSKGSSKTITDHIDAWGAEGKSFTKEQVKELQKAAQDDGVIPEMDYNYYNTKDLALSIGKNAGCMALQSAAITTGFSAIKQICSGEKLDKDELLYTAIKSGTDTSIKTVTAGTLHVAVRKGIIKIIPKGTPAGVVANIACVGVENAKVLLKVAEGEMSVVKGIDQIGRVTVSMTSGLWCAAETTTAFMGSAVFLGISTLGLPLAVLSGMVCGMVAYSVGSTIGDKLYEVGKKISSTAKTIIKSVYTGVKNTAKSIRRGAKNVIRKILG